jgi:hypothetical protein
LCSVYFEVYFGMLHSGLQAQAGSWLELMCRVLFKAVTGPLRRA